MQKFEYIMAVEPLFLVIGAFVCGVWAMMFWHQVHTQGDMDKRLSALQKLAEDTHMLVNSNMGVQLRLNKAVTQRVAELTSKEDDIQAAKLADVVYSEYLNKQGQVDAAKMEASVAAVNA